MNGPLASPANPGQVERPLTEMHWMARGRAIVLTLIGINVVGGRFLWKVIRCGQEPLELAVILSAMITVMIGAPFVNSMDGTDGTHAAAVFVLGAFPVDALLKIIRRLGFPQFTDFEKKSVLPTGCFPSMGPPCRLFRCLKRRASIPSSKSPQSPRPTPCCLHGSRPWIQHCETKRAGEAFKTGARQTGGACI
ncbi:hypothetical protein ACKZDW_24130 [Ralstonia syzygii subsp. celebesensis]|uniref:hypothetical protein n=1 Tax=Ralstonia syzygii TaxID=28097 RepID=UPI00387E0830